MTVKLNILRTRKKHKKYFFNQLIKIKKLYIQKSIVLKVTLETIPKLFKFESEFFIYKVAKYF